MKSTRFDRLLASTALVLVLTLSSHSAVAQQTDKPVQALVPVPDTSLPPPLTAKDVATPAKQVAPANIAKDEPKQNATAPSAEPANTATVSTTASPDNPVADKLRELI
ncbi:MAG: hypothetical protein WAR02_04560, partial [Pseudolabrys sp.]